MDELDKLACVTIQGGGVFGVSLLGQLQAVHDAGVLPVALAGTSAGAIIATLYWSGYHPADILDIFIRQLTPPNRLMDLVGPFTGDDDKFQFTPADWQTVYARLGEIFSDVKSSFSNGTAAWPWPVRVLGLLNWVPLIGKLIAGKRELGQVRELVNQRGLFAGNRLRNFIDTALRESPVWRGYEHLLPRAEGGGRRLLTFADYDRLRSEGDSPVYLPPLFLATTNLTTRRLEVINSIEAGYSAWPVAKAVQASACFPFFFRPVDHDASDGEYSYIDGGVIANFPAFIFTKQFRQWLVDADAPRSDSQAIRPWLHVGLRLTARGRDRGFAGEPKRPEEFVTAVKEIFASQARNELEERLAGQVPRSIQIEQPFEETGGPQDVLDIGQLREHTFRVMYENGRRVAEGELAGYGFALPDRGAAENILTDLIGMVGRVLAHRPGVGPADLQLRANIFLPRGEDLVMQYHVNMESNEDTDRGLIFKYWMGLTGFAFVRRHPLVCNLQEFAKAFGGREPPDPDTHFGFDEEVHRRVRKDRSWLVSVPVFDPEAASTHQMGFRSDRARNLEGRSYASIESEDSFDGPLFGVLNLDAGWEDYNVVGLDSNPCEQVRDSRVQAVVAIMQSCAMRLGGLFSRSFPRRNQESSP